MVPGPPPLGPWAPGAEPDVYTHTHTCTHTHTEKHEAIRTRYVHWIWIWIWIDGYRYGYEYGYRYRCIHIGRTRTHRKRTPGPALSGRRRPSAGRPSLLRRDGAHVCMHAMCINRVDLQNQLRPRNQLRGPAQWIRSAQLAKAIRKRTPQLKWRPTGATKR